MTPSELIPDTLFDEPGLATAYCYTLHLLHADQTRIRFEGEILPLRAKEVLIPLSKWDVRIGMPPEVFMAHLSTLEELDYVDVTRAEHYALVRFKKIHIPMPAENKIHDVSAGAVFSISVNDFAARYLEWYKENWADASFKNVERVMKHFTRHYGRHPLDQLLGVHLQQFMDIRKKNDGVTDTTISMDVRAIKTAMSMAVTWNHLKANPFENVHPLRQDKKSKPFLTREEFHRLLNAAPDERLVPMFTFAVLSGFRRGEILDLTWKDVDFERGVITVESSDEYRVKFGKVRFFPLTHEIRSLLNGIVRKSEYVFPKGNGTPYSEDYPTRKFKMAVRLAELDEALTFHSMRRTFGTWMREAGVATHIIQYMLGHANLKTTESYTQTPPESVEKAVQGVRLFAA
jgi:integrase